MLHRWINTSPARAFIITRLPLSSAQEEDWAAAAAVNPNTPTFIIQTLAGVDIGTTTLFIDGACGTLGIAIHDPKYWGRGYGVDAVRTLVDGAFRARPLVRIDLTVLPDNERAIACYERAGFKREGVLRRHTYQDGAYRDVVMMSILHEEWSGTRSATLRKRRGGRR